MGFQFGRYEIIEEIGQGGFATVYKAIDTSIKRTVAIKILRPILTTDETFISRFRQEAQISQEFQHPNIIPVYDHGEYEGRLFIVMKYMHKGTLSQLIEKGALSWEQTLTYTNQIATALDFVHMHKIVHRDVKPSNIFINDHGGAVLGDWGSVYYNDNTITRTISGSIMGTPQYVAPEIWEGDPATKASDIFALTCVVFEMITTRVLYEGETPFAIMKAISMSRLPNQWPVNVPKLVSYVIKKGTHRDPKQRFHTCDSLYQTLRLLKEIEKTTPYAEFSDSLLEEIFTNNIESALTLLSQSTSLNDPRPLNEVKLLLVGQGNVGKTSLSKQIAGKQFTQNESKTDGIDISTWYTNGIRVNIWDFGGQEIMHSTHQFFLTRRSIYIIVLDSRNDEVSGRLKYWLELVKLHGDNSPTIIVVNKIDDNPIISLNDASIKRNHPFIKSIVRTSCSTGEGIERLVQSIQLCIEELDHLNEIIPANWLTFKRKIELMYQSENKDYISYKEFKEVCNNHNIDNHEEQLLLLNLLHDLGTVMHYYKGSKTDYRLQERSVLNPEWITDGIYTIINSDLVFKNEGVLERGDLPKVLDVIKYPSSLEHEFLIQIMLEYQLCFSFDSNNKFLVPDLLPKSEPSFDWQFEESLNFIYKYSFLPNSVFHRFLVKQNSLFTQFEAWWNGVKFTYQSVEGLVISDAEKQEVLIALRNNKQKNGNASYSKNDEETQKRQKLALLTILRITFEGIHGSFANLKVEARVPVPNHPRASVEYDILVEYFRRGHTHILVKIDSENNYEEISVRYLLEGVDAHFDNSSLRKAMLEKLSSNEFSNLIFDLAEQLSIKNIDDFDGSLSDNIRALISHAGKRNKVWLIENYLYKNYPHVLDES